MVLLPPPSWCRSVAQKGILLPGSSPLAPSLVQRYPFMVEIFLKPLPIKFSLITPTIYVTHFILEELIKTTNYCSDCSQEADYHYHILILLIRKLRQCDLLRTTAQSPCQTTQVSSLLCGLPCGAKSTSVGYKWRNTLVSPVFLPEFSKTNSWEHRAVKSLSLCFLLMFWLNFPLLPQHPWQKRRLFSKAARSFGYGSDAAVSRWLPGAFWVGAEWSHPRMYAEMSYPCHCGHAATPDLRDCHQHPGRLKEDAKVNAGTRAMKTMSVRLPVLCWASNL